MLAEAPVPLLLTREQPAFIRRWGTTDLLHRIRAGVYAPAAEWRALTPWDRYLARVRAVERTSTDPVFCLESAAALRRLPVFGEPRDIHLLDPDGRSWRDGDVVVHGSRDAKRIERVDGARATSLDDTVLDLCRVLPPAFALAVADVGARGDGSHAALDLSALGRAQENRRGLRQLDWVQSRRSADAESVGESVSRAVIEWLGYEDPELQVEFAFEGMVDRVDFFWRRSGTIGESDGYGKYDADDVAATKAHFVREKIREDRLRRQAGGFARWDWADVMRWRQLDAKLRNAGLAPVRARQAGLLATLATNPRSGR
ncbi:hypothetical protein ACSBPH_15585 [Microbacterium sp. F51-2R]|uniref:hypothetical protein n=1 Tax=Microbacterium sp. F51-2R TaxID=3445777 RepID=UPI003FA01C00